jgi:hypothetical protein
VSPFPHIEAHMSKQNKANKNNYDQAGRLTPDEMARERMRQGEMSGRIGGKENVIGKMRGPSGGRESSRPRSEREEVE